MATIYHSRVKGHRHPTWSAGCPLGVDGLTITNEANGEAVRAGPLVDQAARHGVLIKVRDLGLSLV